MIYGATSFSFRSTFAGDAKGKSLKEFFEPNEEVCGKLAVFDSPDEVVALAEIYLGYGLCSTDPQKLQKVQELLLNQKKCVKFYSSTNMSELLKSKQVIMSNNWDGHTFRGKTTEGMKDLVYAYPKEGLLTWSDHLIVPTNAQNVAAARVFMNYILEPEHAAIFSNRQGYHNMVLGSVKFLKKEIQQSEIFVVPDNQIIVFAKSCSPKANALREETWATVHKEKTQ